jgi:hypothetical protein
MRQHEYAIHTHLVGLQLQQLGPVHTHTQAVQQQGPHKRVRHASRCWQCAGLASVAVVTVAVPSTSRAYHCWPCCASQRSVISRHAACAADGPGRAQPSLEPEACACMWLVHSIRVPPWWGRDHTQQLHMVMPDVSNRGLPRGGHGRTQDGRMASASNRCSCALKGA